MKFAGSYSRLKNFESCPKRHYNYDLAPWDDRIKDGESEALSEGIRVHAALAKCAGNGQALPAEMQEYQQYIDKLKGGKGTLEVEKNYAFDRNFKACMYKSPNVFWRCKIDVVKHDGPVAVVWDWKTGKVKVEEDQLFLSAQAVFAHIPEVQLVRASFVWLSEQPEDALTTKDYYRRDLPGLWAEMMPRINAMIRAYETEDFPPKPSGLCKSYCGVTSCIYHGKGSR